MDTPQQDQQHSVRKRRFGGLILLVWWMVLFGIWLVLVDSLAHPEVAAAPLAALLGLLAVYGVSRTSNLTFHARVRWLTALASVPWQVLRDTAVLTRALWRHLVRHERRAGAFRLVPTVHIDDEAEATAFRAFATAGTSFAPNTYVIGIDRDRCTILIHQLVPVPVEQLQQDVIGADLPRAKEGRA